MKRPWHTAAHNERHTLCNEEANRPHIFRPHCDLPEISIGARRPRPNGICPFLQCRRHTVDKEMPTNSWNNRLLKNAIHRRRLEIASLTTENKRGWKKLMSDAKLQSFLGLSDKIWRTGTKLVHLACCTNECQTAERWTNDVCAFQRKQVEVGKLAKNALVSPPVPTLPNTAGHTTLDADACEI